MDTSTGSKIGSQEIDETIPPRPWHVEYDASIEAWTVRDANDGVVIDWVNWTPAESVAGLIVDVVNIFDREGWLEPVTEFQEKLYTVNIELERTNTRLSATIARAIQLIDEDRIAQTWSADNPINIADLPAPAVLLDTLIDVLSGGGGRGYVPCRYPVIPNIGEEGYCVGHATDEFEDVRYCKAHASLLRETVEK